MDLYSIDVSALGDTVWVTGDDGSCVGRFSKRFGNCRAPPKSKPQLTVFEA